MILLSEALEHYKTKKALAEALEISQAAISQWPDDGPIPELHELKLKYEIAPKVFKPKKKPKEK